MLSGVAAPTGRLSDWLLRVGLRRNRDRQAKGRKQRGRHGDFHGFKYNENLEIKTSENKKWNNEIDRINGTK